MVIELLDFVLDSSCFKQDSMGKDGTQLLRHCVRLLVRVSTDLLAVRLSGTYVFFCCLEGAMKLFINLCMQT